MDSRNKIAFTIIDVGYANTQFA